MKPFSPLVKYSPSPPAQTETNLVYSCLEVRFPQESLCSQVWNECSHPEVAALAGFLSVLAQEQEAALQCRVKSVRRDELDSYQLHAFTTLLSVMFCFETNFTLVEKLCNNVEILNWLMGCSGKMKQVSDFMSTPLIT